MDRNGAPPGKAAAAHPVDQRLCGFVAVDVDERLPAITRRIDELGVEQAPGESLEDTARRGAEEALEDETRRILEGILNGD